MKSNGEHLQHRTNGDKRPEEADTIERVREIYRQRTGDRLEDSKTKQLGLW